MATGLGVWVCAHLVGCWSMDRWKDSKEANNHGKLPPLPGTPQLPPGQGQLATVKGQSPTHSTPPSAGPSTTRFGTDGLNTNKSGGAFPPVDYNLQPAMGGMGGTIGTPTIPGVQPLPTTSMPSTTMPVSGAMNPPPSPHTPPPPQLGLSDPMPPLPPDGSNSASVGAPVPPLPPATRTPEPPHTPLYPTR
ncbi:MAG: hypothetical protein RMJ56_08120 [Gemmataceae bacterium]|nr:hypothetical protein [Gemmata sp.]MDW8197556.1 hypothetical protein [Gemmataceae bacterium]